MMKDRSKMGDRVSRIIRVLSRQGFKLPPELALFVKNVVYLSDAVSRHAPADYDMFGELTSVIDEMRTRLGGVS